MLDLLKDPFADAVSSASTCAVLQAYLSNIEAACTKLCLRQFGNFHRLYTSSRTQLLPPTTLQLPCLRTKTQGRRRKACPATNGQGHICLDQPNPQDQGTRPDTSHWSGCDRLLESAEDVPKYVSGPHSFRMWDLDSNQSFDSHEVWRLCKDRSCG